MQFAMEYPMGGLMLTVGCARHVQVAGTGVRRWKCGAGQRGGGISKRFFMSVWYFDMS